MTLVFHLASLASWARAFACLTVPFEVGESFPMLSSVKEDDHLHRLPQGTPVSLSSHRENDTQAEFPITDGGVHRGALGGEPWAHRYIV